jgi:lipoprotein-releasing system ATP-binding protein
VYLYEGFFLCLVLQVNSALILEGRNITKSYGSLQVLKGINIKVQKGEIVSIVGASGAGKSTLLHILGTLDQPDSGEVRLKGEDLFSMRSKQMARFRNLNIGFVFQFHNLLPEFTALENVCIPGYIGNRPDNEVESQAVNLLTMLGLADRLHNKPSELSGGEQQRTAVARALINNPEIVFADEPSGNLDSRNAGELHELFLKLRESLDQTFVIVTHNEHLARLADRILEIQDGLIVKQVIDTNNH